MCRNILFFRTLFGSCPIVSKLCIERNCPAPLCRNFKLDIIEKRYFARFYLNMSLGDLSHIATSGPCIECYLWNIIEVWGQKLGIFFIIPALKNDSKR